MKLADFRGCGLAACAFDYAPVLTEVLRPGREGVTFHEPGQLSEILLALATADLSRVPKLAEARAWLAAHPAERWESQWADKVEPIVMRRAAPAMDR